MKVKYLLVSVLAVLLVCAVPITSSTFASTGTNTDTSEQICESILFTEVEKVNRNYEIYGNSSVTAKEFREIVYAGFPKVYLHYRTDKEIDLPYDALLIVKTASKTYSYEFMENNSNDAAVVLEGIKSFIRRYADIIDNNASFSVVQLSGTQSSVPTTFIGCVVEKEYVQKLGDQGYIVYHIAVSRYTVNAKSILYIVTVNNSFTPGEVALLNGETGYCNAKLSAGYVHMTVEQAYDATEEPTYGRRWGNIPYKKDYWPINNPSVCTIGSSIQAGVNLGYSFTNGFSSDGIGLSEDRNLGLNISFGYSKSFTYTEPLLSVQQNSANPDKCEWYFDYQNDAAITYHQQTNYMFEISNSRADMFVGEFRLKLDYMMTVQWSRHNYSSTHSADLFVRAGTYNDIYGFCYGMI